MATRFATLIGTLSALCLSAAGAAASLEAARDQFFSLDYEGARGTLVALTAESPDDPDARAWLAETHRRLQNFEAAEREANAAIELDPCHAFAHNVLADLYSPGYKRTGFQDYDKLWTQLQVAAECDPDDGNPWLTIWIEAMRRGERETERQALRKLNDVGFFTHGAKAFSRWFLRDLPENAVLITNGDMDTYPLVMIQETEGYRADVAVVNVHMLDMDWYAAEVAERFTLPLSDESPSPYRDAGGDLRLKGAQRVAYWLSRPEDFGRPLAVAVTVADPEFFPGAQDQLQFSGAYFLFQGDPDFAPLDEAVIERSLFALDASDFSGPMSSEQDRSPVRHQQSPGLVDNMVAAALRYAHEALQNDDKEKAGRMVLWAEAFHNGVLEHEEGTHDYTEAIRSFKLASKPRD